MMSVFDNGFLGLNLDRDTLLVKAAHLVTLSIALIVQLIIGITALIKMARRRNINRTVVILFILSAICACIYTATSFSYEGPLWIELISAICLGLFFVMLLGTLITRFYIIFKDSPYRMSSTLICVFSVMMILGSIGWIISSVLYVYGDPILLMNYSVALLYIIASALSVRFFVSNLSQMTKARETTLRNLNLDQKDIELDRQQQQLSDLAAKYMMLFAMAMVSTIVLNILALFVNRASGLRHPIWALDMCLNLWCLYLQFYFAERHYKKCCGRCDWKCRGFISARTKSVIRRHSIAMKKIQVKDQETASPSSIV